jgi:multidrug efflux pump
VHQPGRFNISRWALEHPALTRYLMVVLLVLGVAAYFQLGQDEDPPFTFRVMVVQAFWPGATAQQMAEQVTDKIERTLQEVPNSDVIRSYTKPGESLTLLELKDSTPPKDVPATWYQVRKKVGDMRNTLPQGVIGPVFNDDFGDVYGSIFALSADGFSDEELRVFAEQRAHPAAARARRGQGRAVRRAGREDLRRDLAEAAGPAGPGHEPGGGPAVRAERGGRRRPAGCRHAELPGAGAGRAALGGRPEAPADPRGQPAPPARPARCAGRHRRHPARHHRPAGGEGAPPGQAGDRAGRVDGQGRRHRQPGQGLQERATQLRADLPAGITLEQVQDQPAAVTRSVNEFVKVLIEAVVVVLAVSFLSLGLHTRPLRIDIWPGLVVGITIPLVLAITFITMFYWGVGLHKIAGLA